jgi:hypothetical protein
MAGVARAAGPAIAAVVRNLRLVVIVIISCCLVSKGWFLPFLFVLLLAEFYFP